MGPAWVILNFNTWCPLDGGLESSGFMIKGVRGGTQVFIIKGGPGGDSLATGMRRTHTIMAMLARLARVRHLDLRPSPISGFTRSSQAVHLDLFAQKTGHSRGSCLFCVS